MDKVCCFAGSTELPPVGGSAFLALRENLKNAVLDALNTGHTSFLTSGAQGFDLLAAELILLLKRDYPALQLSVYIPHPKQDAPYSETDKQRYRNLLALADKPYLLAERKLPGCLRERNRRMADKSDLCIAYLPHNSKGDAAQLVRMAEDKGIPVVKL